jgi:murein DD-endopeptidase MepM/ murein hydrolase activator NlpD
MKQAKTTIFFFILILVSGIINAQRDSMALVCPLANGGPRIIRASDKDYQNSSEYGVMFISKTDTVASAVHNAAVTNIVRTDDGRYDIVLQFKSYYFWYSGVVAPRVKKGMKIKAGDKIGTYNPGELLELLMYYQEEPVNPRKYLNCK